MSTVNIIVALSGMAKFCDWWNCFAMLFHNIHETHTHPFNGPFSGTTQVSRYQKGKTNLDFTEARDSEWHWHLLGHMQVCTSLQTDNHGSTPPLSFLQAGCPSCHPTNSIKALKAKNTRHCSMNSIAIDCQAACWWAEEEGKAWEKRSQKEAEVC